MADINCYCTNQLFGDQYILNEEIIKREILRFKTKKGFKIIIATSVDFISSVKSNKISMQYENMYCTMGFNPNYLTELTNGSENDLLFIMDNYLMHFPNKIIAVGECGLDFEKMKYPRDLQIFVLKKQIEIAIKHNKPLYLYERNAFESIKSILEEYDVQGLWKINKIINSFNGTKDEAKQYLANGFYFGINGLICDNNNNSILIDALKEIPLEKIMIGSSAPFIIPNNYQQKINIPSNISYVITKLAVIYNKKYDEILEATLNNTQRFFRINYIDERFEKNDRLFKSCCEDIYNKRNNHSGHLINAKKKQEKSIMLLMSPVTSPKSISSTSLVTSPREKNRISSTSSVKKNNQKNIVNPIPVSRSKDNWRLACPVTESK